MHYGKYRGTVLSHHDPLKAGRLQVRVDAISEAPLGWAVPCVPYGWNKAPPAGTPVWVEFEAGDVSRPVWTGTLWGGEDTPSQVPSIDPAPTSVAAFVGETERGPVSPKLVTSFAEFEQWFGAPFRDGAYLPHAARGFFENGGMRVYVLRVVSASAEIACGSAAGLEFAAVGPGAWGNRIFVEVRSSAPQLRFAWWRVAPPDPWAAFDCPTGTRPDVLEEFASVQHLHAKGSALLQVRGELELSPGPPHRLELAGGSDPQPVTGEDFIGTIGDDQPLALAALDLPELADVELVHVPFPSAEPDRVARAVLEHVERHAGRFAILDPPPGVGGDGPAPPRAIADAALYWPWIRPWDHPQFVPPGGAVAGVYARVDATRGVWKAPAGEALRGVSGVELEISSELADRLKQKGVNCIRRFRDGDIQVWGARTLTGADSEWSYIPVRRMSNFIESSLTRGLSWAIFEPNGEALWAQVRVTVHAFLNTQWRAGAFQGATSEEAFFVNVDRNTMAQDDIDAGRLIIEVGVAPTRPAEFVVIKIVQLTADAGQ